jgi:hypothetical protein
MPSRIPPPKSKSIAAEPVEIANDDEDNNTDSPAYELLLQNNPSFPWGKVTSRAPCEIISDIVSVIIADKTIFCSSLLYRL